MSWDTTDVDRVGAATELDLAARRTDDTLSRFTTMWVVRVGNSLYVRSAHGPESAWYLRALRHGRAQIRGGGVERDVVLEHLSPDDLLHTQIDNAYHTKYDRYGPQIVGTVVGPDAAAVTLRLNSSTVTPGG
jgi:hypothetical protein